MSLTTLPPPYHRPQLDSKPHWLLRLLAHIFPTLAFCATFFGLAMLVVFFTCIGYNCVRWFQVMPELVAERNARIKVDLDLARDERAFVEAEMKPVDEEEQRLLAAASTDEQREALRAEFAKVREYRRQQLEVKRREILADERRYRADTSPWGLLVHFFTHTASSQPEDVGILPALMGSVLLALITAACAVPLGVGAAIYLEEYKSNGWLQHLIQVNINNLAGVPSVMYGVLGAFIFVELIFKPLESPTIAARNVIGGGLTLAMLTLPVVIISSQEALRTVPQSLRHAAYALGATRWQVVRHVVLPAAMPGILTGVILALSRALGEAAPLVLFGALLYVNHTPDLFSRFSVLPMQIFGWAERPSQVWLYNAGMASAVLMITLLTINAAAIYLRHRFQKNLRW
jgi:phosphate transport system permease protein